MKKDIGVAILTHNHEKDLDRCLETLLRYSDFSKVIVFDSHSKDRTRAIAKKRGIEVVSVNPHTFNHGLTRNIALEKLNTELLLFISPDAYLENIESIDYLIHPLLQGKAEAAYGRQIAKPGATLSEKLGREFTYPSKDEFWTINDLSRERSQLFSNAFSVWSSEALREVGGFPETLIGEDRIAAARLLFNGKRIAYVGKAVCTHSHTPSWTKNFKYGFDIGFTNYKNFKKRAFSTSSGMPGLQLGVYTLKHSFREGILSFLEVLSYLFSSTLGYLIGKWGKLLPKGLRAKFSTHPFYFRSETS